jgi:hypothetical protein
MSKFIKSNFQNVQKNQRGDHRRIFNRRWKKFLLSNNGNNEPKKRKHSLNKMTELLPPTKKATIFKCVTKDKIKS